VLAAADSAPNLYASVGVHPDTTGAAEPTVADLIRLAEHPKVVAIGETGLDYYRLPERFVVTRLTPGPVLTELAARSEFQSGEVPPVSVGRSRSAVGRFLGYAVFRSPDPAGHS
jgi:hypothetical protein